MHNIRSLIAATKAVVEPGKWADGGKRGMPTTAFPLSKSRSFVLGKRWRWRVDKLEYSGLEMRLLTALDISREGYISWLSVRRGDSYAILARYEFHGGEPGLHAHSMCGKVSEIPVAVVKPYGTMRIPKARTAHRRMKIELSEATALAISFKIFRVNGRPEGGLL